MVVRCARPSQYKSTLIALTVILTHLQDVFLFENVCTNENRNYSAFPKHSTNGYDIRTHVQHNIRNRREKLKTEFTSSDLPKWKEGHVSEKAICNPFNTEVESVLENVKQKEIIKLQNDIDFKGISMYSRLERISRIEQRDILYNEL